MMNVEEVDRIDNATSSSSSISDALAALSESESDLLSVLQIAAETCRELTTIPFCNSDDDDDSEEEDSSSSLGLLATNLLSALQRIRANLVDTIEGVPSDDLSAVTAATRARSNGGEEGHRLKALLDQLDQS